MNKHQKFFEVFFEEKGIDLSAELFTIPLNGTTHFLEGEVLESLIYNCSIEEQAQIESKLRQIDFRNGDVMHFLTYLGRAYIRANY